MFRRWLGLALLCACGCSSGPLEDGQTTYLQTEGRRSAEIISRGLGGLGTVVARLAPSVDPGLPAATVADQLASSHPCGEPIHFPGSTQVLNLEDCQDTFVRADIRLSTSTDGALQLQLTQPGDADKPSPGWSALVQLDPTGMTVSGEWNTPLHTDPAHASTFHGTLEADSDHQGFVLNGTGLISQDDDIDLAYQVTNLRYQVTDTGFIAPSTGEIRVGPRPVLLRSDESRQYVETLSYGGEASVSVSEVGG